MAFVGRVVTDHEVWPRATVLVEGGTIREVGRTGALAASADETRDYGDSLLLPGFVDLQVNGGFGIDVATEPGRVLELSRRLLSTGTTAYLPTVISSPEDLYREALPRLAAGGASWGAEVLGVHLEGPFINAEKRGAHAAAHVAPADPGLLGRLLDLCLVRVLTLAPELDGAPELMRMARERGAVVSVGHSDAPFETAYGAFDGEAASATHLFDAMSPLHHREPGLPGAALAHPGVVCGLISDGLHVHPAMVSLAFRALGPDRLYLVTDATAVAGMGPGEYSLAGQKIRSDAGGAPRLEGGAIAGSVLAMDEALRNVVAFTGCTLPEAARMAAATPARLIGERKGRLAPGYDADVAVLAPDLSVEAVWRAGEQVYSRKDEVIDK